MSKKGRPKEQGSLRSQGHTLIHVDVETRERLKKEADKVGKPLSRFLRDLSKPSEPAPVMHAVAEMISLFTLFPSAYLQALRGEPPTAMRDGVPEIEAELERFIKLAQESLSRIRQRTKQSELPMSLNKGADTVTNK